MRVLLSRPRGGGERRVALVDDQDARLIEAAQWWRCNSRGYVIGTAPSGLVYLHRLVLGLERGDGLLGDHVNGDRLDNRRGNLRVVSPLGNCENTRSRAGSTSRFRGVSWDSGAGAWRAQVQSKHRVQYLGVFSSELKAALVAHAARCERMPYALPDPELVALGVLEGVAA